MKKRAIIIGLSIILLLGIISGTIWYFRSQNKVVNVTKNDTFPTETPTAEPTLEPTEAPTSEPTAVPTQEPTEAPTPEPTPQPLSELVLNSELQETNHPRIMEILNISSTYTDSVNNTWNYSYQIPQFHADTESARHVNQRMVEDIFPYIEDEFETMKHECSLLVSRIEYEVFECGDMVSVLVTIRYDFEFRDYYTYTYDFASGKEVTNIELLDLRGMTEASFVETACKMEEAYWTQMCENIPENSEDREWFSDAINETKALTTTELPMFLDTDGTLKVYVPFPSMAGASWYYELCEF